MSPRTQLEYRQSVIKSRLSELSAEENPSVEVRSEMDALTTEFQGNETRFRAMLIADADAGPIETRTEDHQLRDLERRSSVGEIFDSIRRNRQTTGATAELQKHLGMDRNYVPLALLRDDGLEVRAAATISGDVQGNQQPVVNAVFPSPVSDFLQLDQPTVPVGEYLIPVIGTSATAHTPDAGADAAESTGAFTVSTITPGRVQASFRWRREDSAKFLELESALRENLNMAIASKLDSENLNDATDGLLGSAGLTARSGDAAAIAAFADYYGLLYDSLTVDGSYAGMASDIKILVGPASYAHAASVYRGNSSDRTALAALMAESGGVMTSAHVPAVSGKDQSVIVRKGGRRDYSNPMWAGIEIVFDDVTAVGTGEIIVTGVLMTGRKLLRSDGFQRRTVQVEA